MYQSKGSLKAQELRKSRMKKKYGNDAFGSSVVTSSIKPSDAPTKKFKKKGAAGLDKESKDLIKGMETKIEDLRKQAFNEINRLEVMIENDSSEKLEKLQAFGQNMKLEQNHLQNQINDVKSN